MANPIIPWLGGKRRLADTIIPHFPAHQCYVEVFAGGAALYFMRPPAEVEVINDINGELVNLYRVGSGTLKSSFASLSGHCPVVRCSSGCRSPDRRR